MADINRGYGPLDNHMYMYDLGWLVKTILSFQEQLDTAIDLKTIHYADPLQWDITTQYSPNTVVVDPKTGTAYMSKKPVPAGIQLDNTDYWVVIFNYQRIYDKIMDGVAFNDRDNLEASKDINKFDFVWFGGDLYQASRDILQGSKYIPGTNLTAVTIAKALESYQGHNRTATLDNDTLTVSGDKTVTAGDISETSANRTIKTTSDYTLDIDGNLSDHVDGVTTINRGGSVTEVYGSSLDVGVTGAYTANYSGTATDNASGKRIINAKDIILKPTNPLTYGTPVKSNLFGTIPMTAADGQPYNLLTETDGSKNLPYKIAPLNECPIGGGSVSSFFSFHYPNSGPSIVQGMTVQDGKIIMVLWKADNDTKIVVKSLATGETLKESSKLAIGHGNSAEYYNGKIYVASDTRVFIVDYETLSLERSFQLSPSNNLVMGSVFHVEDELIGEVWDGTVFKLIKINPADGTHSLYLNLNPQPFTQTIQGAKYYNGYFYVTAAIPSTLLVYDINGNLVNYTLIPKMVGGNIYNEIEDIGFSGNDIIMAFHNDSSNEGFANFAIIRIDNSTRTYNELDDREIVDGLLYNTVYISQKASNTLCNGTEKFPFHSYYEAIAFIKKELGGNGIVKLTTGDVFEQFKIQNCDITLECNGAVINSLEPYDSKLTIKGGTLNFTSAGIENSEIHLIDCTVNITDKLSLYNSTLISNTAIQGAIYANTTSTVRADLRNKNTEFSTAPINSFSIVELIKVGATILNFTNKPKSMETVLHTGIVNLPLTVNFADDIVDVVAHASYPYNDKIYDVYATFTLSSNSLVYKSCDTYETSTDGSRIKFNYTESQYQPNFYSGYVKF